MTNLDRLVDRVEKINRDPKYEELRTFWNSFYSLKQEQRTPVIVTSTMSFFAKNLGIDLISHYAKPESYVEDSLKIIRFQHEQIQDDRVKGPIIVNFGEAFESSLFGVKPVFKPDRDPLPGKPIIGDEADLDNLSYPDFYEGGLMPLVHRTYEAAKKISKGRIPVVFERWDRGPWGLAAHLRGLSGLLEDTIRNPDLVHKMLRFLTESRKRWERKKEKFLGTKLQNACISDDEVDARMMSPKTYERFVYPYERDLANFYPKGIFYFHSCGNIAPFLDFITRIRGLRRIHISPATDFMRAVQKIDRRMVFHRRLDPANDLAFCDTHTMEIRIKEALRIGGGTAMEIDPGPVMNIPVEKVKTWIKIARKAIAAEPSRKAVP